MGNSERRIKMEQLPITQNKIREVQAIMDDIPHMIVVTHMFEDHDKAWLHTSVDLTDLELFNVLKEFFKYNKEILNTAKMALKEAESEGAYEYSNNNTENIAIPLTDIDSELRQLFDNTSDDLDQLDDDQEGDQ